MLSDDTIVEELRVAGIEIARRTVAKYREVDAHSLVGAAKAGETVRLECCFLRQDLPSFSSAALDPIVHFLNECG